MKLVYSIVGVIPKKDWWGPALQSFFWYDNDKDIKAHFRVTQLISTRHIGLEANQFLTLSKSNMFEETCSFPTRSNCSFSDTGIIREGI